MDPEKKPASHPNSDPDADLAIAKNKPINSFLQQETDEFDSFNVVLQKMKALTK